MISNCVINLRRQAQGARRGGARATARRALRGLGRDRRRRHGRRDPRRHAAVGPAASRGRSPETSSSRRRSGRPADVEVRETTACTSMRPRPSCARSSPSSRPQAQMTTALRATAAYPLLLGLGALDAAGYSIIVPVAPAIADATGAGPAAIGLLVATFPAGMVAGSQSPAGRFAATAPKHCWSRRSPWWRWVPWFVRWPTAGCLRRRSHADGPGIRRRLDRRHVRHARTLARPGVHVLGRVFAASTHRRPPRPRARRLRRHPRPRSSPTSSCC